MSCRYCLRCGELVRFGEAMCKDCYAHYAAIQDQLDEERMEGNAAESEVDHDFE